MGRNSRTPKSSPRTSLEVALPPINEKNVATLKSQSRSTLPILPEASVVAECLVESDKGQSQFYFGSYSPLNEGTPQDEVQTFLKVVEREHLFQNEVAIFNHLGKSPRVVDAIGVTWVDAVEDDSKIGVIVLEKLEMDLRDCLDLNRARVSFDFWDRLFLALNVVRSLAVLHEAGIVHNDLKPENFLVSKEGEIKICDFGHARIKGKEVMQDGKSIRGNCLYRAPERWRRKLYDEKADIFGLGLMLWEIFGDRDWCPPYDYRGRKSYRRFICRMKRRPHFSDNIPDAIQEIIGLCWHHDPARRPSCEEIITLLEDVYVEMASYGEEDTVVDNYSL